MSEPNVLLKAQTECHPDRWEYLIHSGRTSLSVVIGFLEDLANGYQLSPLDVDDAVLASRSLQKCLEGLVTLEIERVAKTKSVRIK